MYRTTVPYEVQRTTLVPSWTKPNVYAKTKCPSVLTEDA